MYLFDLNMSKHSPRRVLREMFLKNSTELTEITTACRSSLIMRVQSAWIKSNFYIHILSGTGVFQ